MRPPLWHPSVELSAPEQKVVKRIKKAKLFIFLREVRHELFDDEVIEALEMDRRWQLVLDCLDCEQPPFSKLTSCT